MKAFVISLIVLLFIFALTITNAIYVNNVTDFLIDSAKRLDITSGSVDEYIENWEQAQSFIKISSSHKETHRIDEALKELKIAASHGTEADFEEDRILLIEYLTQIKDDETVTWDSII